MATDRLLGLLRHLRAYPLPGPSDDQERCQEELEFLTVLDDQSVMWEADVSVEMNWSEAKTTEILEALEEIGYIERHWTPRGNVVAPVPNEAT